MRRIVLLFCVLVFLSSCSSLDFFDSQETVEEDDSSLTECPYICSSGSSGIETTINHPKDGSDTVLVGDQFAARVKVDNVGEASADGIVCMTGLNSQDFSGITGCECESFFIDLHDEDDLNYEDLIFDAASVQSEASGSHAVTFYTRYSYTTYGIFELCLSGDPDNEDECSTSTTSDRVTVSSSGPVSVTSVTQELNPVGGNALELRLRVTAEYDSSATQSLISLDDSVSDSCVLDVDYDSYSVPVDIRLVLFEEEQSGACSEMSFAYGEEEATSTCRVDIDTNDLVGKKEWRGFVELDYGYQEIESVQFEVRAD